jgi:hypothetical protein
MRPAIVVAIAACSSGAPPASTPEPPIATAPIDAAPDADEYAAVADAPAWVFRYTTADRKETWTLQHAAGRAVLRVESATGALRYTGTATFGASLAIDVATTSAKLTLDCKPAKRALGTTCNDTKAPPRDVLDCFHPDFKEPMPFGPAPGVEYAVDATCKGYRLVAP